jgi:FKBP-type peptidyl-prolyl cis-trans isomerase
MRSLGPLVAALAVTVSLGGCQPADPSVKETPISLISETVGVGRPAQKEDLVTINYRIVTDEGREILSEDGYQFILGTGAVIAGIDDAVKGMRVSGERLISCPPHRHWGRHGYGDYEVPPNATLTIHIELQAID